MKSIRALISLVTTTVLATTIAFAVTQILLPLSDQQAVAQNATTTTNQTASNQTQGGGAMANLTQADFGPVRDNLITARESLQTNDTTAAYDSVNTAKSELFGLANDQGEQNMKLVVQQFKPIQDSIDSIRDALRNDDAVKALQQLNTADVELLKITQQLPSEEGEGADFGPVRDNLITARESLQTNDTTAAYDSVNTAESELFGLANDQGEQNMQQFKPIQDSIDSIRDALRNDDAVKALQQLNTADVELLKITPEEGEEGE